MFTGGVETMNDTNGSDQVKPPLALNLPESTSFEQWVAIGRHLCLGSQALNWHIGDWWAFGDHRYGERAKAAAAGIFGREFQTLVDLATVARRFESTRRRVDLTFTHHREVAALAPDDAEQLLDRAERDRLSTRDLRREVQAIKASGAGVITHLPVPSPHLAAQREVSALVAAWNRASEETRRRFLEMIEGEGSLEPIDWELVE